MAELRRLGKRGSYRLGRMGAPPAPRAPWPAAHYPSWTVPRRRGPVLLWLLAWLAGAVIVAAGALAGWWFLPFLAGLATGVAARFGRLRLRATLPAAIAVAVAGWGAALAWLEIRDRLPEVPVARTIAALAGLPASAAAAIAVTLLVAALQAAAGLWAGRALAPGHG
jgi:hypothetical protein